MVDKEYVCYMDKNNKNTWIQKQETWIAKNGYKTCLLADEEDLEQQGTQIQLVHFYDGKYRHHHKKKTEFFYFMSGKGKVIIKDVEIQISTGTHILVRPGVVHEFIRQSDEPLTAIMFKTNSGPNDTYSD